LNGRDISEKNAKEIYRRTLEIMIDDVDLSIKVTSLPDYKLTYVYKDGRNRVMSLYKLNERDYAVQIDRGAIDSYVNVKSIERIFDGLRILDSGGSLRND